MLSDRKRRVLMTRPRYSYSISASVALITRSEENHQNVIEQ